jgi:threonine/homoserine/homoserine lactone efflux protein
VPPEFRPPQNHSTRVRAMTPAAGSLTAFFIAATLMTITPGLDTALVLRTALAGGARRAALAGLGICAGLFCWTILVAVGTASLLLGSQPAYLSLRAMGAAYLLWTGYKMLRHPRANFSADAKFQGNRPVSFLTGALTNLLNPKVGLFYVSFLPQFVPRTERAGSYIILLGALHSLLSLIWFACLIAATRPMMSFLQRPATVRTCDRLAGVVFLLFGVSLFLPVA